MHSARTIASWVEVLKPFGYSPLHPLSRGERPTTLIAVENDSHEPVVIKWLTGSAANATTTGEARLTQQMRHPFVVPVRTVHVTDESQLLVLQVAPRGDLFDYITRSANGCLSEREAKRLFSQLVVALEHIHSLGVVHNDVKPDNVFLDADCNVQLGDFGLSRRFAGVRRGGLHHRGLPARAGTLHYSAPETFVGQLVHGPELDVWSAGVVLYVMLCGVYPFWGTSDWFTKEKILSGTPSWPKSLPLEAIDLLTHMLTKSPNHRATIAQVKGHPWLVAEMQAAESLCDARRESSAGC